MFKHFTTLKLILWNQRGEVGGGDPPPEVNYPEDLDKTYHGNPTLLKYYDKEKKSLKVGEALKALVHATSAMGDKIARPSDNFTPEQWKDFYGKIGVPSDPEKYQLKNNLPADHKLDEAKFNEFKKLVIEQNLFPKQAQALLDHYNNLQVESTKKSKQYFEDYLKNNIEAARKEFGGAYDRKIKSIEGVAKEFADDAAIDEMKKTGMFYEPTFLKMMDKIASKYIEDAGPGALPPDQLSMEEIDKQIREFWDPKHPYRNKSHPQNKYYTEKFTKLNGQKAALQRQMGKSSHVS